MREKKLLVFLKMASEAKYKAVKEIKGKGIKILKPRQRLTIALA